MHPILRNGLIALLLLGILWLRLVARDFFWYFEWQFYYLVKALGLTPGSSLGHYVLYAKVLYTVLYLVGASGIVVLYFRQRYLLVWAARLALGWFLLCVAMNLAGRVLHLAPLTDAGRRAMDLFLSPFSLVFLFPVLVLIRKTQRGA